MRKKTAYYRTTVDKESRRENKRRQSRAQAALYYTYIHLTLRLEELNPHLLIRAEYLREATFDEEVEGFAKDIRVYCVEFCVRGTVSGRGGERTNGEDTLVPSEIPFRYLVKCEHASFLPSVIDLSIPTSTPSHPRQKHADTITHS